MSFVDNDGVIHQEQTGGDTRSPLAIARSELAAFKFKLVETVAADPKLRAAPCANAIVVFMSFVHVNERSLKPTSAYASLTTLMAKGGMKRSAANLARRLLVKEGYLAPTGSKTKEGCTKYRLENPNVERVQMHIHEAMEYWQEIAAEQRAEERRKRASRFDVVSEYDTTQAACGVARQHDRVSEYDTNYLGRYLSGLGTGEERTPLKVSSVSSLIGNDEDYAFPVPANDDEADRLLDDLLAGTPTPDTVRGFFREQLCAGDLLRSTIETWRNVNAAA